jgi:hypothetical protein
MALGPRGRPGEVVEAGVHRLDLRFEIGDGVPEMDWGADPLASVFAGELTEHGERDRHPPHSILETVTLELRTHGGEARAGRGDGHPASVSAPSARIHTDTPDSSAPGSGNSR